MSASGAGDVVVVLAGGRSSRFGRDKASAPCDASGEPLALRALRRLAPLASRRALVRAAPLDGVPADVVVVADPDPGEGPLQALAAAFAALPAERWFVAPCDLPDLEARHYRALEAGRGDAPIAFARSRRGDEPLVALWTAPAAAALARWPRERLLRAPVHAALAELGARAVACDDEAAFRNVNTPADLAEAPR